MAKFLIAAADPRKNSVMPLIYDNMESTLTDIQGNSVIRTVEAVVQSDGDRDITFADLIHCKTLKPDKQFWICTNDSPLRGVLVSTPWSIDPISLGRPFRRSSLNSQETRR